MIYKCNSPQKCANCRIRDTQSAWFRLLLTASSKIQFPPPISPTKALLRRDQSGVKAEEVEGGRECRRRNQRRHWNENIEQTWKILKGPEGRTIWAYKKGNGWSTSGCGGQMPKFEQSMVHLHVFLKNVDGFTPFVIYKYFICKKFV